MLDIQINLAHSGAVREEIGERLAIAVGTLRAPVHGDQGFRLEGTTVSGG